MKNKILSFTSKITSSAVIFGTFVLSAFATGGQDTWSTWVNKIEGPRNQGDLEDIAINLLNWGIGLTALVAVVMLIWNGVRYITANGEEEKIKGATKGITYAIIGLVICFFSVLIVNFVISKVVFGK